MCGFERRQVRFSCSDGINSATGKAYAIAVRRQAGHTMGVVVLGPPMIDQVTLEMDF